MRGVRHIAGAVALRFVPVLTHPAAPGRFPCLVAGVQAVDGTFAGVQRTYLNPAGEPVNANVLPSRASLGSLAGGAVRLAEPAGGRLLLGEGIESTAAAGGEWAGQGGRAWRACERVMASTAGDREVLLADLRAIFEAESWPEALSSKALLDRLHSMEGRRWGEWSHGRPMTAHALARLLKPFGIASRNHRFTDGIQSKAHFMAEIEPAWMPTCPKRPNAAKQGVSGDPNPSRPDPSGTGADRTKPYENRGWDGWDTSIIPEPG